MFELGRLNMCYGGLDFSRTLFMKMEFVRSANFLAEPSHEL